MNTIDPDEWLEPIPPDRPMRQHPVAKAHYDRVHRVTRAINEALGHDHPEDEGGLLDVAES